MTQKQLGPQEQHAWIQFMAAAITGGAATDMGLVLNEKDYSGRSAKIADAALSELRKRVPNFEPAAPVMRKRKFPFDEV